MGEIKFRYKIQNVNINPQNIVGEIEYGVTFLLHSDRETAVYPQYNAVKWIKNCEIDSEKNLYIIVDDVFFDDETIFEKIWTVFLFNLLDFTGLELVDVDFSKSFVSHIIPSEVSRVEKHKYPILGTILKPYYQTLESKKNIVSKFAEHGLQIIKEDETFLVEKKVILDHAIALQECMNGFGNYVPNITPYITDYEFVENLIDKSGVNIVMVNFLVCGLGNILRLKRKIPQLKIWGHRVGYIAFEKYISTQAISQMAIGSGVDYLHIGTPRNSDMYQEKLNLIHNLNQLKQIKAVFTKTTSATINELVKTYRDKVVYLACGAFREKDGVSVDMNKVQEWVTRAEQ